MPRYTIQQTYTAPRALTDAEARELAARVERAALDYLRGVTAPWWRQLPAALAARALRLRAAARATTTD